MEEQSGRGKLMPALTSGNNMVDAMAEINITGNIIPQEWYKHVVRKNGKPHLLAITILGDIVYWYRPTEVRDEVTGHTTGWKKKFRDDLLQKSYKAYSNLYGESRDSVKAAFDVLEDLGVIKRYFRDIVHSDGTESNNVMYIELFPEKVKAITFGINEAEGEYPKNGTIPPQKFSGRVAKINDQGTENIGVVPSEEEGTLPENFSTPLANVQGTNTYNTQNNTTEDHSKITTEINNTDYTQSFTSFIPSEVQKPAYDERTNEGEIDSERDYYESIIVKNIGFDHLMSVHCGNKKLIQRILKVMVDAVTSKQPTIFIAKADRSIQEIRDRYLSLTEKHIENVLQNLPEDDSNVGLKDKYLMAFLFNATDTIDAICKTQQMHSKHNMCSREYDWEEIEKTLISNGSW